MVRRSIRNSLRALRSCALKQDAEGGSWQTGHRFASEATDEEITEWVKSIR